MEPTPERIRAALGGDREAFEELIRAYGRPLYGIAYALLRSGPEAEDVVQDTFLKAYRLRHKVREPEKFPAWLAALARNGARDALRRRRTVPLPEGADELYVDGAAPAASEGIERAERQRQVDALLAVLPENHRTAVVLRFMEGMDYDGIARLMGISQGALRGLLGRAMGTLRERVASAPSPFN